MIATGVINIQAMTIKQPKEKKKEKSALYEY